MRTPTLVRTLTPWGWALVAAAVMGGVLISLHGLGFRWDPLDLAERRTEAAETRAAAAGADAAARRFEVEGAASQTHRLDEVHQQTVAVARTTTRATIQARSARDADTPLDPDRAARLVSHDRELCRLAPAVCGTAAVDPAGDGNDALRARTAAPDADPG